MALMALIWSTSVNYSPGKIQVQIIVFLLEALKHRFNPLKLSLLMTSQVGIFVKKKYIESLQHPLQTSFNLLKR